MSQPLNPSPHKHPPVPNRKAVPKIDDYTDVRSYFEVAHRLGNSYSSPSNVRTDLLFLLRAPVDVQLAERCKEVAQRLASTARERRREEYWWSTLTKHAAPYSLRDLNRDQTHEQVIRNLCEQVKQLDNPDATLSDLAPTIALLAMDVVRLSAALDHHFAVPEGSGQPHS